MDIHDITPEFLWQNDISPDGLLFGPNFYPYNPNLKQFSRDLRLNGQKSEAMLWNCLKAKRTGYSFSRQKPILNYIADFFCKELRLVVEIDGGSHFSTEAQERDRERDRQMGVLGLRVIRVSDKDVRTNPNRATEWIMEQVKDGDAG